MNSQTPLLFSQWLHKADQPFVERLPLLRMEKQGHYICAMHIDDPKHYPLSIACQLAHAQQVSCLREYLSEDQALNQKLVQTFVKPWLKSPDSEPLLILKKIEVHEPVKALLKADNKGCEPSSDVLSKLSALQQLMFWALSGRVEGLMNHSAILNALSVQEAAPFMVVLFGKYMKTKAALHLVDEPGYYCIDAVAVERYIRRLQVGDTRLLLGKPRTQASINACLKEYTGLYSEIIHECYAANLP